METKTVEIQFDMKPNGGVIRVNDETGCILRICQIPKELLYNADGSRREYVDIAFPETKKYTYIPIEDTIK